MGISLYVPCDLIHHQGKKIRAQSWPLMQSFLNQEVISVDITCLNTCHNIIVHVLDEGNVLCWDFVFLQVSPHDILRYLIIGLLQVNEHHMFAWYLIIAPFRRLFSWLGGHHMFACKLLLVIQRGKWLYLMWIRLVRRKDKKGMPIHPAVFQITYLLAWLISVEQADY